MNRRFVIPLALVVGVFLFLSEQVSGVVQFTLDPTLNQEISELNQEINDKRRTIEDLQRQADLYKKSLASKQREIASLNYQVSTINQTITKISLEAETLQLKIEEMALEIQNAELKIQATENEIATQKDRMAVLIRTLYQADKGNNMLVILLTSEDLSDYMSQLEGLNSVQSELLVSFDRLDSLKMALVDERKTLDDNRSEANRLKTELEVKTASLEDQKSVKFSLIDETRGQESTYQELLQDLKAEQTRINNDIVRLEDVAREKLNRHLQEGGDVGSGPMIWPVTSRTITAFFHDPDYPYRNVFEHPAIDIRAAQGTPIKAASGGYVARAKDAGMGYSYIMIVHEQGLSTVYGHVSAMYVTEGTFVSQGQIIGLSGGKPGTPGAGRLTTGPHLHFEVRLNGIPVNPVNYLP